MVTSTKKNVLFAGDSSHSPEVPHSHFQGEPDRSTVVADPHSKGVTTTYSPPPASFTVSPRPTDAARKKVDSDSRPQAAKAKEIHELQDGDQRKLHRLWYDFCVNDNAIALEIHNGWHFLNPDPIGEEFIGFHHGFLMMFMDYVKNHDVQLYRELNGKVPYLGNRESVPHLFYTRALIAHSESHVHQNDVRFALPWHLTRDGNGKSYTHANDKSNRFPNKRFRSLRDFDNVNQLGAVTLHGMHAELHRAFSALHGNEEMHQRNQHGVEEPAFMLIHGTIENVRDTWRELRGAKPVLKNGKSLETNEAWEKRWQERVRKQFISRVISNDP